MTLKEIGNVAVESGRIRVGDPCYLGRTDGQDMCIEISHGGDGTYPVFELDLDGQKFLAVKMIHSDLIPRGITVHDPSDWAEMSV